MFSPYYASARRRGAAADPEQFCAINVALYGRSGNRWAMTERGRSFVRRSASRFVVGPSAMVLDECGLQVDVDEIGVPIPLRIRGRIRLRPEVTTSVDFGLDDRGQHRWRPIAPLARVEADFERPGMRFAGAGYLDTNDGDEPLEAGFRSWTWSRGTVGNRACILYDCERRDGSPSSLALTVNPAGGAIPFVPPPVALLPNTLWRVARPTRSDAGAAPRLVRTLEDTPFYNRSIMTTSIHGETVTAVHESLSLDRFASRIVQWMLPFRMPRRR